MLSLGFALLLPLGIIGACESEDSPAETTTATPGTGGTGGTGGQGGEGGLISTGGSPSSTGGGGAAARPTAGLLYTADSEVYVPGPPVNSYNAALQEWGDPPNGLWEGTMCYNFFGDYGGVSVPASYYYTDNDSISPPNGGGPGPSSARGGNYFLAMHRNSATQPDAYGIPDHGSADKCEFAGVDYSLVSGTNNGWRQPHVGDETYTGLSIYFPSWVRDNIAARPALYWHSILSWHGIWGSSTVGAEVLHVNGEAKFRIHVYDQRRLPQPGETWGSYDPVLGNVTEIIEMYVGDVIVDEWFDMVIYTKWRNALAGDGNGALKVWLNDEVIVDAPNQSIGYHTGSDSEGAPTSFFKFGTYAPPDTDFQRTIYFDEFRFADAGQGATKDTVDPAYGEQ